MLSVLLFTLSMPSGIAQIGNPETTHISQIPKGSVFAVTDTFIINANESSANLYKLYEEKGVGAKTVSGVFIPKAKSDFNRKIVPGRKLVLDSVKKDPVFTFYFHDGSHLYITRKDFDIGEITVKTFNANSKLFNVKLAKVATKEY